MKPLLSLVLLALLLPACPTPEPMTDGGGADAPLPLDAGAACTSDESCDDGLFCTGVERCTAGRCVRGVDPCDDGIACTIDSCTESRMRCFVSAPDEDGDGSLDAACLGDDGTPLGDDCDDGDPDRFAGAAEVCDLDDEDCDDTTFGGIDDDGDGFVSAACCNGASCGADCDDARLGSFPGATEVCDGLDQDCDGTADDGLLLEGFVDADSDGWGGATPMTACPGTPGFDSRGGDCNDVATDPNARAQNPGQPEICDTIRNDCSALAPDVGAGTVAWYTDSDGDGFGSAASGVTNSCSPIAGASLFGTDCNDADRMINPAATERCNGIDDNCDGVANFAIAANDFEDDDRDGLVDLLCPGGTDCSDSDPASGPGELERCDMRDNDCDTRVDEGAPSAIYYRDVDRDGFGSLASGSVVACMPVAGYVLSAGDCSDMDASRHPGALETCDSADEDCDAAIDETPASDECSLPNTTSYCLAGRCFVDTCDLGRADCDGRAMNGCEVDVRTSAFNCGSCGVMCPGLGVCGGGICVHSHSSMVGGPIAWNLPRPPVVTIDTPTPGATIAYRSDGGTLGDGTGFFENLATTPATVNYLFPPSGPTTIRWRVVHGPGLLEDVQSATFSVDESPTGFPRIGSGAVLENLVIDGSGPVAAVVGGATVTVTYELQMWRGASGAEAAVSIWVGTGIIADCAVVPPGATYPGTSVTRTFTFTAPTVPGIYPLSLGSVSNCDAFVSIFGTNDIGFLIVGR